MKPTVRLIHFLFFISELHSSEVIGSILVGSGVEGDEVTISNPVMQGYLENLIAFFNSPSDRVDQEKG
jgi:hypothetical protein